MAGANAARLPLPLFRIAPRHETCKKTTIAPPSLPHQRNASLMPGKSAQRTSMELQEARRRRGGRAGCASRRGGMVGIDDESGENGKKGGGFGVCAARMLCAWRLASWDGMGALPPPSWRAESLRRLYHKDASRSRLSTCAGGSSETKE